MTNTQVFATYVLFLLMGLLIGDHLNLHEQVTRMDSPQQQEHAVQKKRSVEPSKKGAPIQGGIESTSVTTQAEKEPPETYPLFGKSIKIADTAIILLTSIIAWFTASLFLEEKDRSRKELRAYLGRGSGEVFLLPNNILRGVVEIKNFGETPAHNVRVAITGELRVPGDQRTFSDPDFIPHKQPIAPTMSWTVGHEFLHMTNQDLEDVLADRKLVYIWGHVQYQDIYNETRTLKFRLRNVVKLLVTTEAGPTIQKWKFYPENEGNEAT